MAISSLHMHVLLLGTAPDSMSWMCLIVRHSVTSLFETKKKESVQEKARCFSLTTVASTAARLADISTRKH